MFLARGSSVRSARTEGCRQDAVGTGSWGCCYTESQSRAERKCVSEGSRVNSPEFVSTRAGAAEFFGRGPLTRGHVSWGKLDARLVVLV